MYSQSISQSFSNFNFQMHLKNAHSQGCPRACAETPNGRAGIQSSASRGLISEAAVVAVEAGGRMEAELVYHASSMPQLDAEGCNMMSGKYWESCHGKVAQQQAVPSPKSSAWSTQDGFAACSDHDRDSSIEVSCQGCLPPCRRALQSAGEGPSGRWTPPFYCAAHTSAAGCTMHRYMPYVYACDSCCGLVSALQVN